MLFLYIIMEESLQDAPTRHKILFLLKKTGGMTNDALSRMIRITPMGVRQHLLSLEREGLVRYETVRHGVGRPIFLYKLTEKANNWFPSSYDRFAQQLLQVVESREGRHRVDQMFQWRKESLLERHRELLVDAQSLADKVLLFSKALRGGGYLVEVEQNGSGFILKQYNCPISSIARDFPEACRYELELYRDIMGPGVQRAECLAENGSACEYLIPLA